VCSLRVGSLMTLTISGPWCCTHALGMKCIAMASQTNPGGVVRPSSTLLNPVPSAIHTTNCFTRATSRSCRTRPCTSATDRRHKERARATAASLTWPVISVHSISCLRSEHKQVHIYSGGNFKVSKHLRPIGLTHGPAVTYYPRKQEMEVSGSVHFLRRR
jgi:hypothetical protein